MVVQAIPTLRLALADISFQTVTLQSVGKEFILLIRAANDAAATFAQRPLPLLLPPLL